jgi:hypothetical protein
MIILLSMCARGRLQIPLDTLQVLCHPAWVTPVDDTLPTEKPLAAARSRLEAARPPKIIYKQKIVRVKAKPRGKVNPHLVAGLNAAGVTQTRIANALGVTPDAITKSLDRLEGGRDLVKTLRESLKLDTLKRVNKAHDTLWNRFDRELEEGTAKDVDALARAASAIEKVAASAAGEGLKVEHSGLPQASAVDLKGLIQVLVQS